jgi:hypothetical protein
MNHISEEQLVLLYYGESTEAPAIDQHLGECEECRKEFRALQLVLNTVDSAPVPERGPEYGQAVWQRIEKRIGARKRRNFTQWWIWAPAMAALLVTAFLAGRLTHKPLGADVAKNQQQIRERILMVAVGDHLERSQMVLAELSNAPDHKGKLDITDERQMASELLDDNRLYRQTARSTGDAAVANVLDDLERVLLEIAHSPNEVSSGQLDDLRQQIESRGLLFKVRVMGSQAREQEVAPAAKKDGKKL